MMSLEPETPVSVRRKGPRLRLLDRAVRERTLAELRAGRPLSQLSAVGLPGENTVRSFAALDPTFQAELKDALQASSAAKAASINGDLEAATAAIARGVRPKNLKAHGLMAVGRLNYLRAHLPGVDERVRAALAKAGNHPKDPFAGRAQVLLAALERGDCLATACDEARISKTDLARRRRADAVLDQAVRARLATVREFDDAAKTQVIETIRTGGSVKRAMNDAGGFHTSTFHAHMHADLEFAARVREAAGVRVGARIRPTTSKAKFNLVLEMIPLTDTVAQACEAAGVSLTRFRALVNSSPTHRASYRRLMAGLDQSKRGPHRSRRSILPNVPEVLELLRNGVCLAEACRLAGIAHVSVNRLRRRDPEVDRQIRDAGHTVSLVGRRFLDDEARRERVLELLRSGVPMYGLGLRGAVAEESVRRYARDRPAFAAELVDALREGAMSRSLYGPAKLEAALNAVAAGVQEAQLPSRGLPGAGALRYYRRKDPAFAARYEAAKRMASGEAEYVKPLSPEELVVLLSKHLPSNLTREDRQVCTNQAWLDAMTGQLTPANARLMAKRYAADVRTPGSRKPYVDENGDLRSSFPA